MILLQIQDIIELFLFCTLQTEYYICRMTHPPSPTMKPAVIINVGGGEGAGKEEEKNGNEQVIREEGTELLKRKSKLVKNKTCDICEEYHTICHSMPCCNYSKFLCQSCYDKWSNNLQCPMCQNEGLRSEEEEVEVSRRECQWMNFFMISVFLISITTTCIVYYLVISKRFIPCRDRPCFGAPECKYQNGYGKEGFRCLEQCSCALAISDVSFVTIVTFIFKYIWWNVMSKREVAMYVDGVLLISHIWYIILYVVEPEMFDFPVYSYTAIVFTMVVATISISLLSCILENRKDIQQCFAECFLSIERTCCPIRVETRVQQVIIFEPNDNNEQREPQPTHTADQNCKNVRK